MSEGISETIEFLFMQFVSNTTLITMYLDERKKKENLIKIKNFIILFIEF